LAPYLVQVISINLPGRGTGEFKEPGALVQIRIYKAPSAVDAPVSLGALFGVLKLHPNQFWSALAVATLGNTLGGLSSYLIGRLIPPGKPLKGLSAVKHWGSPVLLLSWVPFLGDPLCVAAGWLRLNAWWCTVFIAIGKFVRYWVIALLVT
jgi:membrane protein YqaA with SNARE-associated domain